MKGFTLIEILIVIAIIIVLFTLTSSLGINFYKKQQLDTVTNGIVQALRRAQLKAMSQSDYSFGVHVGNGYTGKYTLFRGDSYGSSDDQEVFDISNRFYFSGLSEVVFSELDGIPSATGSIIVTGSNNVGTININELGKISYEYSSATSTTPDPEYCWGIATVCDSSCEYSNYGGLTDYYVDPNCSENCSVAGSFYTNPTGSCSGDGTGSCYKMEDSSTQYLSCSQGDSCDGACGGDCTECRDLDETECEQQEECSLIGSPGHYRCVGRCTSCDKFSSEENCINQIGCRWKSERWYWILDNLSSGYSTSTQCEWYEI